MNHYTVKWWFLVSCLPRWRLTKYSWMPDTMVIKQTNEMSAPPLYCMYNGGVAIHGTSRTYSIPYSLKCLRVQNYEVFVWPWKLHSKILVLQIHLLELISSLWFKLTLLLVDIKYTLFVTCKIIKILSQKFLFKEKVTHILTLKNFRLYNINCTPFCWGLWLHYAD